MTKKSATRGRKRKGPRVASKAAAPTSTHDAREASQRFVRDVVVRGEAATPDKDGKLPLSATHAIVRKKPDGTIEVQRARFKTY